MCVRSLALRAVTTDNETIVVEETISTMYVWYQRQKMN